MKISNDIIYVGVNDRTIDLFEGHYKVPRGMAYNSYVILDEKIAVMDTVDARFGDEWLDNASAALDGRKPDYLIIQHVEPDHSANIARFLEAYPEAKIVCNAKAAAMINNFFSVDVSGGVIVENGGTLSLGRHTLTFIFAPMVHWPEVMMTYDGADKVLFSADAFGKFGALDANEPWDDEARRYYIGIVGKYGAQVQAVLKKAAEFDIKTICPLHGPVLCDNLAHYIYLYNTWSSYRVESEGVVIAYTSVYGNTKKAALLMAEKLRANGEHNVKTYDLARSDMAKVVAEAFRYGKLVLATTTYNADLFPYMREFLDCLVERGYRNRRIALIENGSWAPMAAKLMKEKLAACKDLTFIEPVVSIKSGIKPENEAQAEQAAAELCRN